MGQTNFTKIMKKLGNLKSAKKGYILFAMICSFFSLGSLSAQLTLTKTILGVVPASSGIAGNVDAAYEFVLTNNTAGIAQGIYLTDVMNASTNLGSKFVRVVAPPAIVATSGSVLPVDYPTINTGYNGASSFYITNGAGFLDPADGVTIRVTVELNLRAIGGTLNDTSHVATTTPIATATSNTATLPDCWSNCQIACNNSVQASVNSVCEAFIAAEMVLEGEIEACADLGFYQVSLSYNGVAVSMPVNKSYIGKTLQVSVKNIVCGNSCWGTILLEDKTPPALLCQTRRDTIVCSSDLKPILSNNLLDSLRFPIPALAVIDLTSYPYVVTGLDACGSVLLSFSDSIVKYNCSNAVLSSTLYRKWKAVDNGGYAHYCTDTFDLKKGTLADVKLPDNYDDLAGVGHQPKLACDGTWTKFANGFPDTSATGTGAPKGTYCGNIQFDFSDDTTSVCPGSYILFRRWLILDWCTGNRIDHIQRISIKDHQAPTVFTPKNLTVTTSAWDCKASYNLAAPIKLAKTSDDVAANDDKLRIWDGCSNSTVKIYHKLPLNPLDSTGSVLKSVTLVNPNANGSYTFTNLEYGFNWFEAIITDGCGNSVTVRWEVRVVDNIPPVAICHQRVVVSLGSNGYATIPASVLNDGSHDNCGQPVTLKIARMTLGCGGSLSFQNTQSFCCATDPLNRPIAVALLVTDASGNTSVCMDSVILQDKLAPVVTCPANRTVNCETDLTNLSVFGTPTASDNCSISLSTNVDDQRNACGLGNINRIFTYTDGSGLTATCTQVITVVDVDPFDGLTDIVWPDHLTLNGCLSNTSEAVTGKPTFLNKDKCNQPVARYDDLVFNYVEGVCYKILRNWTVIDWCTYDATVTPVKGLWRHTQVIKISNTDLPQITSRCVDTTYCITENCSTTFTLSATGTDACTPQSELKWSYSLEDVATNTVILSGNVKQFTRTYLAGAYRVNWRVEDQCGNATTCSYVVTVKDCKRPTPYCNNGIVSVLMENSNSVTIWAKDFNLGSSDNCTGNLLYSFTQNVADSFKTFTCADIPDGKTDTIEITLYVTDQAGNFDLCKTKIILQDNKNVCPDKFVGGTSMIAGAIRMANQNGAAQVPVSIYDQNNVELTKYTTNDDGKYEFALLNNAKDYMVKPNLDKDPAAGITTRDILLIQKHILGIQSFNQHHQFIAADVNNSKSITARDLSDLRKLILGVTSDFQENNSWNFISSSTPFDINDPYKYSSEIMINNLNHDMMNNDFIAVKTGDVTGEAKTSGVQNSSTRSNEKVNLVIDELDFTADDIIEVPVYSEAQITEFNGLQMAFQYDDSKLEFIGITSAELAINATNYNVIFDQSANIRLSYSNELAQNIDNTNPLFILTFKTKSSGRMDLQSLFMNSKSLQGESYLGSKTLDVDLQFRTKGISNNTDNSKYVLYQNIPNPFSGITNIQFNAPKNDDTVELSIYDLSGKVVYKKSLITKKGLNEIEVKLDANIHGILYYKLDANEFIATRKMVVIR